MEILVNGLIAAIIAGLVMRYFYVQEQLRQKGQAELQALPGPAITDSPALPV
jgi:two-component system sensor histidine kinase AlgZ